MNDTIQKGERYTILDKLIVAGVENFKASIQVQDGYIVILEDIEVSDQQKIKR